MEIVKYETKVNYVNQVVDALKIEDNMFLCLGEFDGKYGLDYKQGKSLRNYRVFDLNNILSYIPVELLENSSDARQFLFDMFMGAVVYLTADTSFTIRLLAERYISQEDNLLLIQFFNIICTSQPGTGFFPYKNVSVDKFINNFKLSDKPGDIEEYNILELYVYEKRSAFREHNWVYLDNVFDTTSEWKNRRVIPADVIRQITGKRIGAMYFNRDTLMAQTSIKSVYKYIWYKIPYEVMRGLKYYSGDMYSYILDALLSIADYSSDDEVCSIEPRVVTDEVFVKYAESLNNSTVKGFAGAINAMCN